MRSHILFLSILCFGLFSCKKDRSCSCTLTTEGTQSTRTQTPATVINIPPLPPVEITPAKDTTAYAPYRYTTTQTTDYTKVSKNTMRQNCPKNSEEGINDVAVNAMGTSTITVSNSGKKTRSCEIK